MHCWDIRLISRTLFGLQLSQGEKVVRSKVHSKHALHEHLLFLFFITL
jgi:hypothetical protein